MAKKQRYNLMFDNIVAASSTDIQMTDIVPAGKTLRLFNFGGYDPIISNKDGCIIALQWGAGTNWQSIRMGGSGFFDCKWVKGKDFIGDGAKRFRIIRQNVTNTPKVLAFWLDVFAAD